MATAADMEVCGECGWYLSNLPDNHECKPREGRLATKLMKAVPSVKSTKLGYGDGNVTFAFDKNHAITFRIRRGRFNVESVFWLDDLTPERAQKLVEALAKLA